MQHKYIHACPNWRGEGPRCDCVFIVTNPEAPGFRGMDVTWMLSFFSFNFQGSLYLCAVIHWYDRVGKSPDEATGMQPKITIIHVESIFQAAHLAAPLPSQGIHPNNSYNQ
ncbi:hypothetical protein EV363DRAFT_1400736 [Boletus edulis]|nr:hypothetical protein EV363DRAFT_1400736 [Boletus edulis]